MYDCEICGRKTETLYVIDVEGAQLSVCAGCSRGKTVVNEIGNGEKVRGSRVIGRPAAKEEDELVDGYGMMIRRAREAMKIDIKVLGERINEKHSTLLRVEEEKMVPDINLTAKLEKALGIRLGQKPESAVGEEIKGGPEITLGDAALRKGGK